MVHLFILKSSSYCNLQSLLLSLFYFLLSLSRPLSLSLFPSLTSGTTIGSNYTQHTVLTPSTKTSRTSISHYSSEEILLQSTERARTGLSEVVVMEKRTYPESRSAGGGVFTRSTLQHSVSVKTPSTPA